MAQSSLDREISPSTVFSCLANQSRRRILHQLATHQGPIPLPSELDNAAELHHVHLPKLADAGYVEWDNARNQLLPGPQFDDISPLLTLLDNHEDVLPFDLP